MLKEVFITPQVFTEPTINSSSWKDIKYLLESLLNSGYLIGGNRKKWIKDVRWNISFLEPRVKDRLMHIISGLKDRDRIVDHPSLDSQIENEQDWLVFVLKLNAQRNLNSIFATHSQKHILSPEQLEDIDISDRFGVGGSQSLVLSSDNISNILIPFLSYAKKLTIVDPYFYLHETRYEQSLRIMANLLGERRGERQACTIVINCKWASKLNNYKNVWKNIKAKIQDESDHKIEIYCWEEQENSIKMHDRFLITNQSGLVSAAGTNVDDLQQSEWSIKDYRERDNILSNYKENSSPFKLMHHVSTRD
jgi:hypothetical protein